MKKNLHYLNKKLDELKKKAEEIISNESYSIKEKIDGLLEMDCYLYTNLGINSTKEERDEVRKKSLFIYREIKNIDSEVGACMLSSMSK